MKKIYNLFVLAFLFYLNIFAQKEINKQSPLSSYKAFHSVMFVSENVGWIVGKDGTILKSTNGGNNWKDQSALTKNDLYSVYFADENNGIAVGKYGIKLKTTNGGNTWNEIPGKSIYGNHLYDVFLTDSLHGITVGQWGEIYCTSDGGITWEKRTNSETYYDLLAVFFMDRNNGVSVGGSGRFFKTSDGGITWIPYQSIDSGNMTGVFFTDSVTGTVVGNYGNIYKTTNGGSNWVIQKTLPHSEGYFLNDVSFFDNENGVIVGKKGNLPNYKGVILKTTNGGTTWSEQNFGGTTEYLYLESVSFINQNNIIAVGDSGTIMKTSDGGITWSKLIDIKEEPILSSPKNNSLDVKLTTTFSWVDKKARAYQLQISTDSTFTSLIYNDSTITSNKVEVNQLVDSTKYYWRVRAIMENVYLAWSQVWNFTTIAKTPRLINPENNSLKNPTGIALKWSETIESTHCRVQISTDSLFILNVISKDNIITNTLIVDLSYNTKYFWRVGAINLNGHTYWSNCYSFNTVKTSFPFEIGNKWYYQAGSTLHGNYYGVTKEITNTLSDGFSEITAKYYYHDSIVTKKEYWVYKDGNFFIEHDYFTCIYDDYLKSDSCYSYKCWYLINYNIFGIEDIAQKYTESTIYHSSGSFEILVTFPQIGIVKTLNSHTSAEESFTDSTYLIGLFRNGAVLGDTTFKVPPKETAYFSLEIGQKWYYELIIPYDNNEFTEEVIREVIKIEDNGFRKIKASYLYKDSIVSKIEYWAYQNGKFYISSLPDFNNAAVCYDLKLMRSECHYRENIKICRGWLNYKYNFMDEEFEAQYYSYFESTTKGSIQKRFTVANFLGPVEIRFSNYNTPYGILEKLKRIQGFKVDSLMKPDQYNLSQNYPNPFNSKTTISYQLTQPGMVTLKVYDLLGKEVAILVNEDKPAGFYDIEFSAGSISSGIYFYRLQSGSYIETKKLILMK